MQINEVQTVRRQEAHRKALELKENFQIDEAINLMMHALHSYGPNILLLIDVANLFKSQNEIGNYYYYGCKIEQEWTSVQDQISEKTKSDVCAFLGTYLLDRGRISRSIYYFDLAYKSAVTTSQHIVGLSSLLNVNAEFKCEKKIQSFYLECLKLKELMPEHTFIVEQALLKSEIEILGAEQTFYRLEKFLEQHGAVDSGFHSLVIQFILKCLLSQKDISMLRDKLFGMLNRINPLELSIFEKIVIQFFDQPHYFLHAQEMSYLQQRLHQSEILDVYYLNYLFCTDSMVKTDLRALFQLMLREGQSSTEQLMRQKYFNEKITEQRWKIYLHSRQQQMLTLDGMMPLQKTEYDLMSVFCSHPRVTTQQVTLQFHTQFEIKELVMRLNQKIYTLTGIPDALTVSTSEVKLLESIDIVQKK